MAGAPEAVADYHMSSQRSRRTGSEDPGPRSHCNLVWKEVSVRTGASDGRTFKIDSIVHREMAT